MLSRRNFLILAGLGVTGAVVAAPLRNLYARVGQGKSLSGKGFGPLVPDPQGLLDLPEGFQYRAFSRTGEMMNDGSFVPGGHDGMAAFPGEKGTTILVRNHELNGSKSSEVMARQVNKYDPLSKGGTTTLIVGGDRQLIEQRVSLAGTTRNCGGGSTPWGSWISCEEDIHTPAMNKPNNPRGLNISKKHGYNFEVPSKGIVVDPVPLVAMGRFNHEAIAVDPKTGIVYQTEDRDDGCFYRFIPKQPGKLAAGGVLEALAVKGMPKLNTSKDFPLNEPKSVEWLKIEDVDPERDTVRVEAKSKGAAIFQRGEGICLGNGEIYFACTSGGQAGKGQIFRYNPIKNEIELFAESPGAGVLDYPDNIIAAPFGDLIMCEDGGGEQFLVGINAKGEFYPLGRNALNPSELAGVCFAPDGKTMFVNIQTPGITFAIWGPWSTASQTMT